MQNLTRLFAFGIGILMFGPAQAADLQITDTHIHYSHDAWDVYPPAEAVGLLRSANVRKAFVSSSSDDGTQLLYKEAPDLIVPVLRPYRKRGEIGTWIDDETVIDLLREKLSKNTYAGIGEFHAFGDDVKKPVMQAVISFASEYDIFLHAHSDSEAVDLIFESDPDAIVLWAHSGFASPREVRGMLEKHDNLWADLAFRSEQATNGVVDPQWRQLFTDFPDRFMVGTDTFAPERWSFVGPHANYSREWIRTLPEPLASNIAYRNAELLLEAKRR